MEFTNGLKAKQQQQKCLKSLLNELPSGCYIRKQDLNSTSDLNYKKVIKYIHWISKLFHYKIGGAWPNISLWNLEKQLILPSCYILTVKHSKVVQEKLPAFYDQLMLRWKIQTSTEQNWNRIKFQTLYFQRYFFHLLFNYILRELKSVCVFKRFIWNSNTQNQYNKIKYIPSIFIIHLMTIYTRKYIWNV